MEAFWRALIILTIAVNFQVKKSAFVCSDSIGLSIEGSEINVGEETFTMSSLCNLRKGISTFPVRCSKQSFTVLLLLLCGDVESFPGPDRYIPEMASLMSKKGIKIFHQNVRGLCSNSLHICELMQSYNGIDILTLSETLLTEHEPE